MDEEQILKDLRYLEELYQSAKTMDDKMTIKDQQLELYRKLGLIKPPDSPYDCEGCSG